MHAIRASCRQISCFQSISSWQNNVNLRCRTQGILYTNQQAAFASSSKKKVKIPWRKKQRQLAARQKRLQEEKDGTNTYKRERIRKQNYIIDPPVDDGKRWRIMAACILHRYPIIQPDPEEWQVDFDKVRYEKSLREDLRIPKGFWTVEPGTEELSPEEAPSPFEPDDPEFIVGDGFHLAPRITEDDKIKNQKSLDRALASHLVLLTRQPEKLRRGPYDWFFPFGEFKEGVTMRKMAIRQLKRTCGKELEVYPIGNAPIGYLSFLHKEKQSEDAFDGTKVFLYKSRLMGEPNMTLKASRASDFVWVTREELNEYLEPELASYIYKILPP